MKSYLFSYVYKGDRYSFTVQADSKEEAIARTTRMSTAMYDGESVLSIPVPSLNLWGWLKRWFR